MITSAAKAFNREGREESREDRKNKDKDLRS
jgi:hypothetical protein